MRQDYAKKNKMMTTPFYILLLTLIISLIVFLIWNIILFKKKISTKNEFKEYFELKYQLQFYVAVFSVLIGVFSFLGYSSYNDIVDKVKNEISKDTESSKQEINTKILATQNELSKISIENERIKETNKEVINNSEKTNDRFYKLYEQFLSMNRDLYESENELQSQINNVKNAEKDLTNVKKDISEIKKIDFLNQVYLVTDLNYREANVNENTVVDTVYFKNLKTISGSNLPIFKKPPSLTISPYKGVQLSFKDVTKEYFTIYMWTKTVWEEYKNHKYDLLIIYKEAE